MALAFFEVERGYSIEGDVQIITGSGVPGTSGDSTLVGVGSIYMDQADGGFHKKITAGSGTNKWNELAAGGSLAGLQTEVDNIETSMGSMVGTDGTFTALSGTNHLDGGADVSATIVLLDSEIGADVTAVVRTNNPIVNGASLNSNIDALDAAIGADASLTPVGRTTGLIAVNTDVMTKFEALDTAIGPDQSYNTRTVGQLANSNDVLTNVDALDNVVGADSQLASTNHIAAANTIFQNLSALDNAIQSGLDGLDAKESCRVATTGTLTATAGNGTWVAAGSGVGKTLTAGAVGTTTLDGVLLADGDRVLVKDEGTGTDVDNGMYVVSAAAVGSATILTRALDFDDSPGSEVTANAYTFVSEGTANADFGFVLVTNDPIVVDTTALMFSVFSSAGGLGALQTEINNIEAALGSCINASGNFVAFAGTNHIDSSADICAAISLLDSEIGADPTGLTRTVGAVTGGNAVNANIDSLDTAIGASASLTPVTRTTGAANTAADLLTNIDSLDSYLGDDVVPTVRTVGALLAANDIGANLEALDTAVGTDAQLTAVVRTTGAIATSQSVNQNIDDLDAAIGADVVPTVRTVGPTVAANSSNANIDALDTAIGTDAQLTAVVRTVGAIVTTQSVNENIDDLDAAIGADVTSTNFLSVSNTANANISALDTKIGANLTDGDIVLAANTVMANLIALDAAINSVGVQTQTTLLAATLTTVDSINVDTDLSTQWLVHIRDGINFVVAVIDAVHNNIPSGSDATDTDHSVYSKLRIGTVAGEAISVDLSGTGAAQVMRLRITTTNASEVSVMRFAVEA